MLKLERMKSHIIIVCLLLLLTASCSKDFLKEDPRSNLTPDNFYKTSNDLNMAAIGLYTQVNGAFNQSAGFYAVGRG